MWAWFCFFVLRIGFFVFLLFDKVFDKLNDEWNQEEEERNRDGGEQESNVVDPDIGEGSASSRNKELDQFC